MMASITSVEKENIKLLDQTVKIEFTKLEGIGNDYLFIEDWESKFEQIVPSLSVSISNRNFGVGSDGVILVLKSSRSDAHLRMRIFNSDGSEAEMCGNGVRSFAKYVFDRQIIRSTEYKIETAAGIIITQIVESNLQSALKIRVDMGEPRSISEMESISVDNQNFQIRKVSMGNPHCIIYVKDYNFDYHEFGKKIEHHEHFQPNRTNVEFIQVINPNELNFRVWERGSGETLACGTGACAAVVASVIDGKTNRSVIVHLKGGDLLIEWDEKTNRVFMTGPSREVFSGTYLYKPQNV